MVTVLGRPGRGASQVEKSPRLNWASQFLTILYDGACSPNVSVRMAWISFSASPCRGGGLDDCSRLNVVEIARIAWHASFQTLKQEKICNSAHGQTSVSNDTIDSVLRHREVGRAKDLSASLRISVIGGSLSPRHGAYSGYGWRNGLQYGGQLRVYWISNIGQPTRGGRPSCGLGEVLTPPHRKKLSC